MSVTRGLFHLPVPDIRILPNKPTTMNILQQQPVGGISRATVFDIPLLVDLIARHLIKLDIYRCTLVSHKFYDAFQHRLYTRISIERKSTFDKFSRKEAVVAFSSHLSSVREVSTPLGECIMLLVKEAESQCTLPQARHSTPVLFRNLTVLRYNPDYMLALATEREMYSAFILSLLEAAPALQVLHVSGFADHSETLVLRLATVIRDKGRRLKHLFIEGSQYSIDDTLFYTLLWSAAAVEVLHLGLGPHSRNPTTSFAKSLPTFTTLAREALYNDSLGSYPAQSEATESAACSLGADKIELAWKELGPGNWLEEPTMEIILELLQMCPFLERMVFPKLNEQDVITHLAPFVAKSMPQLRHLDLTHISDQPLGSCCIVQSCKDLISLTLGKLQFNPTRLVDAVVQGHSHSLQSLHIERSNKLTSQQLNLILSNSPCLLSLYALTSPRVYGRPNSILPPVLDTVAMAMVPEEPGWSCKDLKTLQLYYRSESWDIGIPEVLWRQIGQLSKLRDLTLHRDDSDQPLAGSGREKKSVKQALSSWMALSDLRRLELRGLRTFIDARWVKQTRNEWAKLDRVRYTDN